MPAKERPILYSTDMVVSILEDRKTKTRRLKGLESVNETPDAYKVSVFGLFVKPAMRSNGKQHEFFGVKFIRTGHRDPVIIKCPYGQPGDILWVRESFCHWHNRHGYFYKASGRPKDYEKGTGTKWSGTPWKPSIHMPKVAARIWLQIVDINVERLQDITEEDALAEGIIECEDGTYYNYFTQKGLRYQDGVECLLAKGSFQSLWCSINGLDSWKHNPWVWVISFKVLSKTGKPEQIPSGFKTPLSCDNESLKSSPNRDEKRQVEEAHLLPGNGERGVDTEVPKSQIQP